MAITVWNAIAQVFIQGYPEIFQSDKGREFISKILDANLISINGRHILGSPYHPQSKGAIEAFNKTVQKSLSTAYENTKQENLEWDLELNLIHFLHFYNCKRVHTTTGQIPWYVLDNFNDAKVRKLVIIQTEKSRKKHSENSLYKINNEILLKNWINKINPI